VQCLRFRGQGVWGLGFKVHVQEFRGAYSDGLRFG